MYRYSNAAPVRTVLYLRPRPRWKRQEVSILPSRLCRRRVYSTSNLGGEQDDHMRHVRSPISVMEFKDALERVCKPNERLQGPHLIGLAVSGGLDSSCLAYLARGLQRQYPSLYRFRALVVDHKARPGSTAEALAVRDTLQQNGLPTSLLEVHWPFGLEPLQLRNFETLARKLRYPVLGQECHRLGIRHLLLAQHEDDQAETMLGRMINGYIGRGLAAMAPQANIPESHGIYGSHNLPRSRMGSGVGCAERGVQIHRPFLGYSKDRLRATCQEHGVNWVEDKTNSDRTFTLRNACRYILESRKLPAALQKRSLLNLSRAVQRRVAKYQRDGIAVLGAMQISNVDLRSGKLTFSTTGVFMQTMNAVQNNVEGLAAAFSYIAEALSPMESIEHAQMVDLARKYLLDASMVAPEGAEGDRMKLENSFTLADLFWHKRVSQGDGETIWTVSRAPHTVHNPRISPKPCSTWSDSAEQQGHDRQTVASIAPFGTWQLYDGRFWIRVWNSTRPSLVVRPFEPSDLEVFRRQGEPEARSQLAKLEKKLRRAAPGKIRWTLPAIAESFDGRVLALPTLHLKLLSNDEEPVKWEVQYKHSYLAESQPNRFLPRGGGLMQERSRVYAE